MNIGRDIIDAWVPGARAGGHTHLVRLEEGDTVDGIPGPAIVELVLYRDGGWSAHPKVYETVESIALAASLAQR